MTYAIKEIFATIQGEGGRAGSRSVFVRFAGCNLWSGRPEDRNKGKGACAQWCDTDFVGGEKLTAQEIVTRCELQWKDIRTSDVEGDYKWIVLTGGEPSLQVDETLIELFHRFGWKLAIETNGTRTLGEREEYFDWITVSPKKGAPLMQLEAHELKVVLPGGDPGWTDEELAELAQSGDWELKYVQPQDPIAPNLLEASHLRRRTVGFQPDYEANAKRCVDFVMGNPEWRLSFQVHKVVGIP